MGCQAPGVPAQAAGEDANGASKNSTGSSGRAPEEIFVVIRVLKAELFHHFHTFCGSSMSPFAVVKWQHDKKTRQVARTLTNLRPGECFHWNHTCREQPYYGENSGDKVELSVRHERAWGFARSTSCGKVVMLVDDMLTGCQKPTSEDLVMSAPTMELTLKRNNQDTGLLTVQALLMRHSAKTGPLEFTKVDPEMFEKDIRRLGVSGGTAPFFCLHLRDEVRNVQDTKTARSSLGSRADLEVPLSKTYYIGKDLSHARDEVNFYEEALQNARQSHGGCLRSLHNFMFEYAGILEAPVEQGEKTASLLVMRNLRDGCKNLRLLDVKIGEQTADAGWQGKSRVAAFRQGIIDGITNSSEEGFRLEGFDGAPPALTCMDPLLDVSAFVEDTRIEKKIEKKAFRLLLQRMPAAKILRFFVDVHQEPADPGKEALATTLAPIELAEIVMHQVVMKLTELALACCLVPVPQKWIGSSVALGYDSGTLPKRSVGEEQAREAVRVYIFDWGRSEFNTLEKHMELSDDDQTDRAQFWGFYKAGIDRFLWEAMRSYWHFFANNGEWGEACLSIYDWDSMSDHDHIGRVQFPLEDAAEATHTLLDSNGSKVYGVSGEVSTLTFSVKYRALPEGSRLKGTWCVHIAKAQNLTQCDLLQGRMASDPFAVLDVKAREGDRQFRQQTSIVINSLNPEWNETLEVPIAAAGGYLEAALQRAADGIGMQASKELLEDNIDPLMLPEEADRADTERAVQAWRQRVDWAAASKSGHARDNGKGLSARTSYGSLI